MTIDINSLPISDDPIYGVEEDAKTWKPASEFPPPPKPGTYSVKLTNLRDAKEFDVNGKEGKRLTATFDLTIISGTASGRVLAFQRVSNTEFATPDRGRTSTMLDMIKSAGYSGRINSNKDFLIALDNIEKSGKAMSIVLDWRGTCLECLDRESRKVTGADPKLDKNGVRALLTPEQKKAVNVFALKAKNYRAFPESPYDPEVRLDVFECADCGGEVRAQGNIVRWCAPGK